MTPLIFFAKVEESYSRVMSIKLALLKSGEDIISDVQEMIIKTDDGEKVIGYFFNKPCTVSVRQPEIITESDNAPAQHNKFEIKLFPWITLSKDTRIPVPADWVVTIVEPIDKIKEIYENQVLEDKNGEQVN